MNKINPEVKAREVFEKCKSLVSKSFANPITYTEMREMICAYDLSIMFCDTVINTKKWYQFKDRLYWLNVKNYLIEDKLYFYESSSYNISKEFNNK